MSKKRSSSSNTRGRRVTSAYAKRQFARPFPSPRRSTPLTLYEDRRTWNPLRRIAPARSFNKVRHRLIVSPKKRIKNRVSNIVPHTLSFEDPRKVLVCVRRKIRREVMHAIGKSGQRGQRRPRRSEFSGISCR